VTEKVVKSSFASPHQRGGFSQLPELGEGGTREGRESEKMKENSGYLSNFGNTRGGAGRDKGGRDKGGMKEGRGRGEGGTREG
jgi:hypothetical protein